MADVDEKRLRELAEKAAPGPWLAQGREVAARREPGPGVFVAQPCTRADQAYIAAVSPDVVIALLDELARLRSAYLALDTHARRAYPGWAR